MRGARFLVAAGLCDLATGLVLVAAPSLVLELLAAGRPVGPTVFVRWIGAFVAAVGAAYLYPLLGSRARRRSRLATVAEVTALQRAAVALFVTAAVAAGALAPGWLAVAAFDGGVAAAQVGMLRRGWLDAP